MSAYSTIVDKFNSMARGQYYIVSTIINETLHVVQDLDWDTIIDNNEYTVTIATG